jgi:hypothetical protein
MNKITNHRINKIIIIVQNNIQSRINSKSTMPAPTRLTPSEWAANLLNKNPKERTKPDNR